MPESPPEPRPLSPIVGGHLRASDADRDKVAAVLSTAYAEGRLTRDEHDERLDEVMRSKTFDDLLPITQDLVALPLAPAAPSPAPAEQASSTVIDTTSPTEGPDRLIAVFGGSERKGVWRVRKTSQAVAIFGGVDLDLNDAVFESPIVEIEAFCMFGGIDLKLPAGMEVRDQTIGIFGGTEVRDLGERQPGAPVLVIKGMSMFGGMSIRGPKPPKKRRHGASAHTG